MVDSPTPIGEEVFDSSTETLIPFRYLLKAAADIHPEDPPPTTKILFIFIKI
jgi:hypothetical protein